VLFYDLSKEFVLIFFKGEKIGGDWSKRHKSI